MDEPTKGSSFHPNNQPYDLSEEQMHLYPSFHEAQLPLEAQPVDRPPYHANRHYVAPDSAPPYDHGYSVNISSSNSSRRGYFMTILRLIFFHILNAGLGMLGFMTIVIGSSVGIGLIPLCCFGIVVFRVVIYLAGLLAEVDVRLSNFVAPPQDYIYLNVPYELAMRGFHGYRLAPDLSKVSPLSIMASIYFASVKFAIGILSGIVLFLVLSLPPAMFQVMMSDDEFDVEVNGYRVTDQDIHDHFLAFIIIMACILVIGISLMFFVAKLSTVITKFFCSEEVETLPGHAGRMSYGSMARY